MKKFLAAVLAPFNVMVRECGWCPKKRILGFVRGGKGITTSICKKCGRALQEGTWKKGGDR